MDGGDESLAASYAFGKASEYAFGKAEAMPLEKSNAMSSPNPEGLPWHKEMIIEITKKQAMTAQAIPSAIAEG
ncbi:hypothetical protein Tco_0209568 [Tanacetum coccineum]